MTDDAPGKIKYGLKLMNEPLINNMVNRIIAIYRYTQKQYKQANVDTKLNATKNYTHRR